MTMAQDTPVLADPVEPAAPEVEGDLLAAASILVVDDEPGMLNFLRRALEKDCALLEATDSIETADALRQRYHFDLMILDIRLPGITGIEWLRGLRERGCRADVIFMTAFADLETAIEALRAGATDFILKPFRVEQMLTAVRRCLERRRMLRENLLLRRQMDRQQRVDGVIGNSPAILETCDIAKRVAASSTTVLLTGETGTGKELMARAIHDFSGRRGPFVPVNCGSISHELLESELFGHTKGAFTGAASARDGLFSHAHDGTLFLDEIGEMPLGMQAKLLRVLEDRRVRPVGSDEETPVNARVLAATNRDLEAAVEAGEFRRDLYFRLNVLTIRIPALRERRQDVVPLVDHFMQQLAFDVGLPPVPLQHADYQALQDYAWPGNVRELKNVIERALLLGKLPAECVRAQTPDGTGQSEPAAGPGAAPTDYPLEANLAEVEKHHMLRVLEAVGGNKSEAARRLGVSRKTMERKLNVWQQEDGAEVSA